jgi:hypothetical protein
VLDENDEISRKLITYIVGIISPRHTHKFLEIYRFFFIISFAKLISLGYGNVELLLLKK